MPVGVVLFFKAMLYFDIRSLETRAASVDAVLDPSDPVWLEDDPRPAAPGVHVVGRLSGAGNGRFYLSGRLEGTALGECRRCLSQVQVPVNNEVHLLFAESDLDEADEDDVVRLPAGEWELDLRPSVREEWLLAAPAYALCKDDCRGLCPSCGVDLNRESCTCTPTPDPRWAALRNMREAES